MSFTLDASEESPIHNVCFRVTNWDLSNPGRILVDGKPYEQIRQTTILDTGGKHDLIAFIELRSQKPTRFTISKDLSPAHTTTLIDSTTRNGSFEADGRAEKPKGPLTAATDWDVWTARGKDGGWIDSDHPTDGASSASLDEGVAVYNLTAHTIHVGDRIIWSYDKIRYGDRRLSSCLVYDDNGTVTMIDATEITQDRPDTYGNAYTVPPGGWVGKKLGIGFYSPPQARPHQSRPVFDNVELRCVGESYLGEANGVHD